MTVFGVYRFSLGPLVSKVKEHHVETIVDSLCSNMLSDNEQLRDISSIGESSCRFTWILMPSLLFGTSILFLPEEAAWQSGEHIVGPIIWWCQVQVSLLVAMHLLDSFSVLPHSNRRSLFYTNSHEPFTINKSLPAIIISFFILLLC